ncbi:MFS transporter [Ruminococcus sp.]|uniref:MFS transporter n=1 Tax=Ruminococcus sp. TaxID=41978 RepID=UPI0025F0D82C|nr:MFS transporter [Ruminococcus sp.]MCR4640201.1 MFS transporter [Ruminococcus sp.]
MFNIRKQLSRLYLSSVISNLTITGAWLAILASRGFSLVEIGISETVFHITSIIFELPSGVMADVFGRKKMLIVSNIMYTIATLIMIASNSLFTVCLSVAFHALTYNFSSGTGDALAYDSMKKARIHSKFERYESNQLIIYRVCTGISTLCAGFALTIGYKLAYATDLIACAAQFIVLSTLTEVNAKGKTDEQRLFAKIAECFIESFRFLKEAKKALGLMFCNSFVGALDILLLFFLQAKLPEKGIPKWGLGIALLFMELGGVLGSKLILHFPKIRYISIFAATSALVLTGILAEHSRSCIIMALGGFIAAVGDDALQVRTNAKLQKMFPSEQRATLTSVESFTFSVIMIVLSPLAGFVFTYW